MYFNNSGLHQRNQPGKVVEHQHRLFLANVDPPHGFADAGPGMLCIEAFGRNARRAAHQAQHAIFEVRQDPVGDAGVEFSEALFGHPVVRPENPFRMGEADSGLGA